MGRKVVDELVAVILEVYSKILLALIYCPSELRRSSLFNFLLSWNGLYRKEVNAK